jgi:hypothetical protein
MGPDRVRAATAEIVARRHSMKSRHGESTGRANVPDDRLGDINQLNLPKQKLMGFARNSTHSTRCGYY